MNISGTYEKIRERALLFADSARRAVGRSHNEAEFQRQMSNEIERLAHERFLRSLFSLSSGRALIPENLVEDFGNQNILSQQVTRALYNALGGHANDLPARLFEQPRFSCSAAAAICPT